MSNSKRVQAAGVRFVRGPIDGISEYVLDNGLKVLLMPDSSTQAVTTMVVYRVGSRNEGPGETGSAHFFEHLMFKGSRKFNALKGNNLDELLKRIGARNNAYTWNDQTVYYEQLAGEYLELALAIEADRMRNLRMTKADRDSEMTVVRNEMEQGENHPDSVLGKQIWATAFTEHPYHHDTIGSRTEVENVPMEKMRAFYNTYYWPNNATLIIAGAGEESEMLRLAVKHFGKIPASPHKIPQVYTVEPPQEGERRFEIRRAGNLHRLSIAWHIPNAYHADMAALDALTKVLGNSWARGSRLYKALVDTHIASLMWCNARDTRDPGLLEIDVNLNDGVDSAAAEAAVLSVIEKVKEELVGDEELARIKECERKEFRRALADATSFAFRLGSAEATSDWTMLRTRLAAFEALTAEQIRDVARKYLTKDNRTVGVFVPKAADELTTKEAPVATAKSVAVKAKKRSPQKRPEVVAATVARYLGKPQARKSLSQRIVSTVLPNGMRVNVLKEKPGCGVVSVGVAIKCGNYFEKDSGKQNLTDITASLVPMGSVGLSKEQIADEMKTLGMEYGLDFHIGPYIGETRAQVVSEHLPRYLSLLNTVMRRPAFEQSEFDTVKQKWTADYKRQAEDPNSVAANILGNTLFKEGDMFFQKNFAEELADLQSMTLDDVKAFHKSFWTPGNTIITIVGDIDSDAAVSHVQTAFGDWQGAAAPAIDVPQVALPEARTVVHKMADKPGVAILLGYPADFKKTDDDYEAVKVAREILGGDTLTARLGKKLREEGGLTYGVYVQTWDDSYGATPFFIGLNTNAANVDAAVKMAQEVFADFVANGITEDELKTQVDNLIGKHQLNLDGLWMLAYKISKCSALGVSLDSIDQYASKLRALTVADVNAAIKKHFHPDNFLTVVAGGV